MRISRRDYIAGLREFADFLEHHPDLPMPDTKTYSTWCWSDKYDIAEMAKKMGFCQKQFNPETVGLVRRFKGVGYQLKWSRGAVCKRVITGYRKVEKEWAYAKLQQPQVEMEPIYEWQCSESLLKACEE